jgi:hypothetical protein
MGKINSSILWLAGHAERDRRSAENSGTNNIADKGAANDDFFWTERSSYSGKVRDRRTVAKCATDVQWQSARQTYKMHNNLCVSHKRNSLTDSSCNEPLVPLTNHVTCFADINQATSRVLLTSSKQRHVFC